MAPGSNLQSPMRAGKSEHNGHRRERKVQRVKKKNTMKYLTVKKESWDGVIYYCTKRKTPLCSQSVRRAPPGGRQSTSRRYKTTTTKERKEKNQKWLHVSCFFAVFQNIKKKNQKPNISGTIPQ